MPPTARSWFQIRSWHALDRLESRGPRALCGRWGLPGDQVVDELPAGKSCESCLRIAARQDDV